MNENSLNKSNYIQPTLKIKDYFLSGESFELVENTDFGFLETQPRPIELGQYYQSENYISHTDSKKSLFDKVYQFIKIINFRHKFFMLTNPTAGKKLLDYGCGTGDFLSFVKNKKLEVLGVEPNPDARKIANGKIGADKVLNLELKDIDSKFDIITLWHVLEHIPNLYEFIEELKKHLNPEGEILIAVPNHRSYDAKFYKNYWAAYDVPRHLWHFNPESMEKLIQSFGMKIENKYPLWFDSFYVSMLSEKYKQSAIGFWRAIFVALISNIKGVFTGNYSSIVYKIRKN